MNVSLTCLHVFVAWSSLNVSLLPFLMFIICVGLQRCRRRRSSTTLHSDVFTFNVAAFEVIGVLGYCAHMAVHYLMKSDLVTVGQSLASMATFGQVVLHSLICLERYLAVVHPVTYLLLKKKGVVIRNVSIAALWTVDVLFTITNHLSHTFFVIVFASAVLSLMSVSFFCAGVLFALIRPGPGEGGRNRRHTDQSKRRAFYTVAAITVALMIKFSVMFLAYVLHWTVFPVDCLLPVSALWFNLPSSLVMPTLFLCCRAKRALINTKHRH